MKCISTVLAFVLMILLSSTAVLPQNTNRIQEYKGSSLPAAGRDSSVKEIIRSLES